MGELRKAAVLLLSLPREQAANLLGKLSVKEIEAVLIEIARISAISRAEQDSVILEFADVDPQSVLYGAGGLDVAKELFEKAPGQDAIATIDQIRQSLEPLPFGKLANVAPQDLLPFIAGEHPQTIALIVAHLPATQGADLISMLTRDLQLSVIRRISAMGPVDVEIVHEVERVLERRMASVKGRQLEQSGGVPAAADILSVVDWSTEHALLARLAQDAPELAEEICERMVVVEAVDAPRAAA